MSHFYSNLIIADLHNLLHFDQRLNTVEQLKSLFLNPLLEAENQLKTPHILENEHNQNYMFAYSSSRSKKKVLISFHEINTALKKSNPPTATQDHTPGTKHDKYCSGLYQRIKGPFSSVSCLQ